MLCESGRADFAYLRDTLELTDGNLSRNLTRLHDAGYITVHKVIDGRRPRTWLSATRAGRTALNAEIAALFVAMSDDELACACSEPVYATREKTSVFAGKTS